MKLFHLFLNSGRLRGGAETDCLMLRACSIRGGELVEACAVLGGTCFQWALQGSNL